MRVRVFESESDLPGWTWCLISRQRSLDVYQAPVDRVLVLHHDIRSYVEVKRWSDRQQGRRCSSDIICFDSVWGTHTYYHTGCTIHENSRCRYAILVK